MAKARLAVTGIAAATFIVESAAMQPGAAFALPVGMPPGVLPGFWLSATADGVTLPEDLVVPAQGCEFDCEPAGDSGPDPVAGPVGLSRANTDDIVALITEANQTCGTLILRKYRIDCLRWYYLRIARAIPDRSDYLPIRLALERAAGKLKTIVVKYRDPAAKKIRPRIRHQRLAPQTAPLRAVREADVGRAAREAAKVVEETKIVILRSGEDPTRRTAHYREIASAVDANLVILRSA
ncbi:MAG: hypothetical protein N2422_03605 [Rhodobacteraceae bacterium]|nr:hypothetical protein [Paracoccaceae bacterium]